MLQSNTSVVLGTPGGRMTSSLAQQTSMPGGHWDTQRCSQLLFPLSLGSQLLTYLTNVIPTMLHSGRKSDRRQNLSRGGACPCAGSACTRHMSPQPRERRAGQQKAHPHLSLLSGAFFFVCVLGIQLGSMSWVCRQTGSASVSLPVSAAITA